MKITSKVLSKSDTQQRIKALRNAGLKVDKIDGGYVCEVKGQTIFKAMNGSRGYLVRHAENLFSVS